ncbi:MAG: transporter substrate-binding domain-containing protein [Burkholderiales bacterium]|nr:transporter substrate-binding domain-containing protein [Burkholderiales bacterium]
MSALKRLFLLLLIILTVPFAWANRHTEGIALDTKSDASKGEKNYALMAENLANSLHFFLWNMDDAGIAHLLMESLRTLDVVAIQTTDSIGKSFVAWRDKENRSHVQELNALPKEISKRGLVHVTHPLIAEGKVFAHVTLYLRKPTGTLPLTAKERAYIKAHPVIRASNEIDYPPFDFTVGGHPQGYSIDLLNLLAKHAGFMVKYITGPPWDELMQMHKNNKLDLLHTIYRSPEREKIGIFSDSYASTKTVFVVRKGDAEITHFAQLKGKTVAVGKGWAQEEFLRTNYPEIKLLALDSLEQMLTAVSNGAADATLDSDLTVPYWMRKKGINDLKISGWAKEYNRGKAEGYYFYTSKKSPELVSILNKAMASMPPGELQELQTKWFGNTSTPEELVTNIVLSDDERNYLKQKGALRMCVLQDWLPYEHINSNNELEGIAGDMVAIMQQRVGAPFELVPATTESDALAAMRERRCDVLPMTTDVSSRVDAMVFTLPSFSEPLVIATNARELFVKDSNDIGSRPIGIRAGFPIAEKLRMQHPSINIVDVLNAKDGLDRVRKGELWGYVDAMAAVGYILQKYSMLDLKIAGKIEFDVDRAIASRNDEPLLASIMQKASDSITEEERRAILGKWVSVRFEQGGNYTLVWQIGAGIGVLLILAILWNRHLAKLNKALQSVQEAHRKTAAELMLILDNAGVGILMTDGERRMVRVNQFLECVMLRANPGTYLGNSVRSTFVSDEEYDGFLNQIRAANSSKFSLERTVLRHDGTTFLASAVGSYVDPSNPNLGMVWFATDITERRAAENKLAQTLQELETILNNAWIGVFVTSGTRQIVRMNHYCESVVFKCPPSGYIGQSTRALFSSDADYADFTHKVRSLAAANVSIEYPFCHKDGTSFLAKSVGSLLDPADPGKGAIWLVTDITEQRAAEKKLTQTLAELETILNNAWIGVFVTNGARRIVRMNHYCEAVVFQCPSGGYVGQSTRSLFASDDDYDAFTLQVRSAGMANVSIEYSLSRKDGTLFLSKLVGSLLDPSAPEKGAIWLVTDITKERADAEKLTRTLSELDIIFQNASIGIALFVDRRFVRVNKTYEVMFGWSAAELIGQTARRLFASDEAYAAIDDVYQKLAVGENILRLDLEVRCADGRDILCECVSSYVDPSDPAKGVVWLATDVTDLRHAQTALQNARDDALAQKTLVEQQHILVAQTLKHVATLLNNSGQGFLSFGQDLLIDEGYSRECNRIFGCDVGNLPVPLLLCSTNATQGFLEKTLRLAMDSANDHLRRDAYMGLLPAEYRLGERYYTAQYRLLEDGHMMLILTDVTDERQLKERLKLERLRLEFIVHALENRDDLLEMLGEFEVFRSHTLPGLLSFEQRPRNMLAEILRHIHTFKSLFAQARLPTIPQVLHELENRLGQLRDSTSGADAGAAITTNAIKRHLGITDLGAALESDLALLRQTLGDDFFHSEREVRVPVSKLVSLEEEASALYGADSRMLGLIRYLRYVPVQALIEPHAKAAEQLALRQGKLLAPITCTGATVPVDPTIFGPFCKSLVHLFRNAVDHGIEDADTRLLADKSETASIHCTIHATDDQLTFKISDDGCGIDVARVRAKAIELGKLDALESSALNDADVLMLIFADGVTTRDHISPISGRGVGLSAVQHELEQLGGRAQIESTMGQGSCFTFTLPYHPPVASTTQPSSYEWVKKYLAPLPEVFKVFCDTHLQLAVTINMSYDEYTIDNLFDFTALISLGSGLDVRIGLSIEQPLLLEMTQHFEPGFSESEVKELANSVGAEIANTVVGNASVYFTHLARRVAMGTPDIVFPEHRANTIGLRTFRGFTGQADAGSFMIFCLLSKENTA